MYICTMRIVFTRCPADFHCHDDMFAGHDVSFKARGFVASGPTVYVAYTDEHVQHYGEWFKGVEVRVRARLRDASLEAGSAVYLPVSFDSWVVFGEGACWLGAALEAAAILAPSGTVVVPAFAPSDLPAVRDSLRGTHRRWHDRVVREAQA